MSEFFELNSALRQWVESVDNTVRFAELATLDPRPVPRRPRLLVPVDVQALVVRGTPSARGDIAVAPADTPADEPQVSAPFSPADPLAPGVHLHWALPDALTAGEAIDVDGDGDLEMPPLPDRWVVTRVGPPVTTRRTAGL